MSDSTPKDRHEVEDRLTSRAMNDPDFRQQLINDPKAAVQDEMGVAVPSELTITVLEETPDTLYLVIPATIQVSSSGELSDAELGAVAGGGDNYMSGTTCPLTCTSCYVPSTCGR
jgi:hypothetical protein